MGRPADVTRITSVQYIGSHNSYHAGLAPGEAAIWQRVDPKTYAILTYAHPSLSRQLDDGVRQVELDVYGDVRGGRYATPAVVAQVAAAGLPPDPPSADPAVMAAPGFKVMHIQDMDQRATCQPLEACLRELFTWSEGHPGHLPIFVLLETEETPLSMPFATVAPEPFDADAMNRLEAEITRVFPRASYVSPDDVRGRYATLNQAVRHAGWPTLASARGRFVFLLDQHSVGKAYLQGHPSLRGRAMFTNAAPGDDDAAFLELNDGPRETIAQRVREGYLVRTRTDVNLKEAAANDTRRRDTMFASGAQLLSTDFPKHEAAPRGYVVAFPGNAIARCDPLTADDSCLRADLSH
ncbi:phosphatidylinositol-specific phospholipase C1-like protein [Luteibacter sp. PPL201]|uniref:Phosphatidylinositol-specific phospholipase C1-like protein n=1 Tax=Luteibacter sahnii TaxID=3021977 RepID=A0ABT6BEA3_9GAMM